MKYDFNEALNEALNRVMNKVEVRLSNMQNWFIHDYLFFQSDCTYAEAVDMELRAFGCVGGH